MVEILKAWAVRLAWLPVGSMVLRAIVAALQEWWRKAELSADRAGLLASQDPAGSLRLLMKLAGGGDLSESTPRRSWSRRRSTTGPATCATASSRCSGIWAHAPVPVARAADPALDRLGRVRPHPGRRVPAP
jgi:Zn-dependent protease with chaperone function